MHASGPDDPELPSKAEDISQDQLAPELVDEGSRDVAIAVVKQDPKILLEPRLEPTFRAMALMYHQGPLPPPQQLREYGDVIKDGPERILRMAEISQQHAQTMQWTGLQRSFNEARLGQIFGFTLGLVGLVGGIWLAATGQPVAGTAIVTGCLVGLVTVFVTGRSAPPTEKSEKPEPGTDVAE